MRKTKIVATVGLVSEKVEMIKKLIEAGVDIFRLNLSHGDREWHSEMVKKIRSVSDKVGILIDTRGPEIRTGDFEGSISLKKDEIFKLVIKKKMHSKIDKNIYVSYPKIMHSVKVEDMIALDGGMLFGEVLEIGEDYIKCLAQSDWDITSRRHVNLPGERVDLPTLVEDDIADLEFFSFNNNVDYIALSFTRSADDIKKARQLANGKQIIAKIENFEGVNNFSAILKETDGIMVARGDLGVEMPVEKVPVLQRRMVRETRQSNKFVIVATEMLESMVNSPRPTRAEVSDVATAVFERADAVMLSQESAMGKYPVKSVETMRKVIEYAEEGMVVFG